MARIRGLHPSLNPSTNPSTPTSSGGDPPYRKKGAAAVGLPTACEKTHSKNLWTFFSTILLVLIALPAVDLAAQDCIDFEIDPETGTEWVELDPNSPGEFENEVSNQYEISHGITFQVTSGPNMPANGNAYPRICKVGAPGEAFIYGFPISSHPNYCDDGISGGDDNPAYSTIPNNPNFSAPPLPPGSPPMGSVGSVSLLAWMWSVSSWVIIRRLAYRIMAEHFLPTEQFPTDLIFG